MVQVGDFFENLVSGQWLIFRKTAADTGGELLAVKSVYTKPSPSRPPVHLHPHQEERFEVLSGEVHALVGGEEQTLRTGELLVIPPGTSHGMRAEKTGARLGWQTRPALRTKAFFETVWGLAKDGKVNGKGVPNPLRAAVIAWEYTSKSTASRARRRPSRWCFSGRLPWSADCSGTELGTPTRSAARIRLRGGAEDMLNAIGRELPEHVDGYGRVIPFAGALAARPTTRRYAPPVKKVPPKGVRESYV